MKTHNVKILPEYFVPVMDGRKTFELRKNDRGYAVGDFLCLQEWDLVDKFTGDAVMRRIVYMLEGPMGGIENGYCILGIAHV